MLPEKGSASEGSAAFSGDIKVVVCFARIALAHREANDKALRKNQLPRNPKSRKMD
jgi:hypothetical protein